MTGPCQFHNPEGGCINEETMRKCLLCRLKVPTVTCDNLSDEMKMIVNLGMKQ